MISNLPVNMAQLKDKIQYGLIGLLAGLLLALSVFVLKLDKYFNEKTEKYLGLFKRVESLYSNFNNKTDIEVLKDDKNRNSVIKEAYSGMRTKKKQPLSQLLDSSSTSAGWLLGENARLEDVLAIDSLLGDDYPDLIEDKLDDDIVVKKDEFLLSRIYEIKKIGREGEQHDDADSLLERVSGVKDENAMAKNICQVEFWRSPLNYKGYKMARNKIILFGVSDMESIHIFQLQDDVFIKYGEKVYRMVPSDDFRQFELVNDGEVLLQIN